MQNESSQRTLQGIKFDIRVKKYGSLALTIILVLICLVNRNNPPNLAAGLSIFLLLLAIFLIGLRSDLRALKYYEKLIKETKRG